MRTSRLLLSSVVVAVLFCVGARAAEEAQPAQFKIGVVDLKQVFDAYQKQKDQYTDLRAKRDTMQKPIDELSKQITTDRETYDKGKEKMSADEKRSLEEKIEAAVTKYKAEYERAQQDIDRAEKKLMRDLFEEIYIGIQEVGAQGNYHLVFDSGDNGNFAPGRAGGLLYHSSTLNMTQKVIDHLNAKYKAK